MPLSPLDAYQEVMDFAARRGEAALCLAMHAAMPQVLRVELLHLLRLNFVPESIDDAAVEADVLFAPFCEPLGNGYYRFDAHARRHLVKQLDPHYRGEDGRRSRQVASFLLSYFDEQRRLTAESNDVIYSAYVEVERWVALAFFDPDTAARQLAGALSVAAESGPSAARFRFSGLTGAVAMPFAGQHSLLAYTAAVEALERGDVGSATDILEPLGDAANVVAGVPLPAPSAVLRAWAKEVREEDREGERDTEAESEVPPQSATTPREDTPDRVRGDLTIFVSASQADSEWADRLRLSFEPENVFVWLAPRTQSDVTVGPHFREEIREVIDQARIAVVLVSMDYLTNEVCQEQLQQLLRRAEAREVRLAWILVRDCDWQQTRLAHFQAAHDVTRPLARLRKPQREQVLAEIARNISQLTKDTAIRRTSTRRIFLCYRRGQDDEIVHRIADAMRREFGGDALFDHLDSLELGVDFWEQIRAAINSVEMMLVFIGRDWSDKGGRLHDPSDFVRQEIAAALRRDIRVIPIVLDADVPVPDQLPHDIRPLGSRQALVIREPYSKKDIARLVKEIGGLLRSDRSSRDSAAVAESTPAPTAGADSPPTAPVRIFYCYAHEDEALRDELAMHLKILERRGLVESWHDRHITEGDDWKTRVDAALQAADLVLLLVSPDFIASDYIVGEEVTASAMQRHASGLTTVVPIIVRAVDTSPPEEHILPFLKLQSLPTNMRPVTSWPNRDEAWTDVAKGLRQIIKTIHERKRGAPLP